MFATIAVMVVATFVGNCVAVWPQPHSYSEQGTLSISSSFHMASVGAHSGLLDRAIDRYMKIIFGDKAPSGAGSVTRLAINVSSTVTKLDSKTDESYSLSIGPTSTLDAHSVYGAMRGLETFAQLIERRSWTIKKAVVVDKPRFHFRGMLFDTSRHFLPVETLYKLIDALAYNKFNVFHWHIVDSESFPYQSTTYPLLTRGAYSERLIYSQQQVHEVIEYSRDRGIRVVVEFDTPGHSESWAAGYPQLVTKCYTGSTPNGDVGPLDPTYNGTFPFLQRLYEEIDRVFPDDYVHIGGDEVSFDCWRSNPAIQAWMKAKGWTDYAQLEQYYEVNLIDIVEKYTSKHFVVWQG